MVKIHATHLLWGMERMSKLSETTHASPKATFMRVLSSHCEAMRLA